MCKLQTTQFAVCCQQLYLPILDCNFFSNISINIISNPTCEDCRKPRALKISKIWVVDNERRVLHLSSWGLVFQNSSHGAVVESPRRTHGRSRVRFSMARWRHQIVTVVVYRNPISLVRKMTKIRSFISKCHSCQCQRQVVGIVSKIIMYYLGNLLSLPHFEKLSKVLNK